MKRIAMMCAVLWSMATCLSADKAVAQTSKLGLGGATIGVAYESEVQTDFRHRANWMNVLRIDASVPLVGRGRQGESQLALSASTISTAASGGKRVIDDLQGFSNIEAEGIALTLAVLSLDWTTQHTTLSVGIRNVNERYFTTDLSSFFTQSSHGIPPTLSANCDIANYPVASMGIDFEWRATALTLNASVYNGQGYARFSSHGNLFRICPKSDGVFALAMLSHEGTYGNAHIGASAHDNDERTLTAIWGYGEFNVGQTTQLLAHYSVAPSRRTDCKHYAAVGLKQSIGGIEVAVAETYASYAALDEWATELTTQLQVNEQITLQPALHFVRSGGRNQWAGLLRMSITL